MRITKRYVFKNIIKCDANVARSVNVTKKADFFIEKNTAYQV